MSTPMNGTLLSGSGKASGEITVTETPYGLLFQPHLSGLIPGSFHVPTNPGGLPGFENGKAVPALQAGGYLDSGKTGEHMRPYNDKGYLAGGKCA